MKSDQFIKRPGNSEELTAQFKDQGLFEVIGKMNDDGRLEKKYYVKKSVGYFLLDKTKQMIQVSTSTKKPFERIGENILNENEGRGGDQSLLEILEITKQEFDHLIEFYETVLKRGEEIFSQEYKI